MWGMLKSGEKEKSLFYNNVWRCQEKTKDLQPNNVSRASTDDVAKALLSDLCVGKCKDILTYPDGHCALILTQLHVNIHTRQF